MKFRLGVVPYLNALPLHWTLGQSRAVEIVRAVPSKLAGLLENGEFDAALLPVVDHLRGVGDGLLGDAIIGATGQVRSVLLFSRVPIEKIESIAADTSSHTSVALLKVLFDGFFGQIPPFFDHAPNLAAMLETHDAALLIGDPALEAAQNPGDLMVWDLASAWRELTGLPFVFAAWTARNGLKNRGELENLLNQARDEGVTRIAEIVAQNPLKTGLPPRVVESYLKDAIQFWLTGAHHDGLEEFRRRCAALQLLD